MGETKLKLEMNPSQMELFNTALNVWKQEHVQRTMKDFLVAMGKDYFKVQQNWNQLKLEIIDSFSTSPIAEDLDKCLAYVIEQTGERIYRWFHYMTHTSFLIARNYEEYEKDKYLGLKKDAFINYCVDKIHWTEHGLIDESKTISLVWLNIPDIRDFQKFYLASLVCDEPLIDLLWEKLPNDVKDSDYSYFLKDKKTYIVAYWIKFKKSTLLTFFDDLKLAQDVNLPQDVDDFNENKSVEEFILSCCSKYSDLSCSAVQYLIKKLTPETVQKNMPVWFLNYCNEGKLPNNNAVPILLFLYNEMSDDARQNTFSNNHEFIYFRNTSVEFLDALMWSYPFQELLAPALSQLQTYLNVSDYTSIFCSVQQIIYDQEKTISRQFSGFRDFIQPPSILLLRQLPHLWRLLPANAKFPTVQETLYDHFNLWDIPNIKIIINDKDLREKRETLLRFGYEKFMEFVLENKFDTIYQFIDEILIAEDLEDDVRTKVKKIYQILMIDLDVKSTEEYLNSHFNKSDLGIFPDEHKKNLLKNINHEILIYYFFGKERMELIREYFEKIYPDDLKTFKESIKNYQFTLDLIYKIWFQSKGLEHKCPDTLCNEFLLWLFDSKMDDVATFRKNVILKDLLADNRKKLRNLFSLSNRVEIIDNFLSWSCSSEKDIRKVKSELLRYSVLDKFLKLMDKNDLVTSKKLLDWAFKSEKNKRKFKSRFISSRKGITALMRLIVNMKSTEMDPNLKTQDISRKFKDYINFWMESLEDMAMGHRYLQECLDNILPDNEKEHKGKKIKLDSDGNSTTFERAEDDSSEDEDVFRLYFHVHSASLNATAKMRLMDEKNLVLFLNVLDESMKEKLRVMKMSK